MLSNNILLYPIYCALFLSSYSFQLIGCDRDPETGEKIETNESSKNITDKQYFINYNQCFFTKKILSDFFMGENPTLAIQYGEVNLEKETPKLKFGLILEKQIN